MRGDDDRLVSPLFTLLEEGYRFAPDRNARALGILRTIVSEGPKFGFNVGIISQRPSKLDADILSQCGTQIITGITNSNDQQAIRQSVESAGDFSHHLADRMWREVLVKGIARHPVFLVNSAQNVRIGGCHSFLQLTEDFREEVD